MHNSLSPRSRSQTPLTTIPTLIATVNETYNKLEQAYLTSNTTNQTYLLTIYMKILNQILDDVVYSQQKVRLVDCDLLKDNKCVNYMNQIRVFRDHCYQVRDQVNQKKQILRAEKNKTSNLLTELEEIKASCQRKNKEFHILSQIVSSMQAKRDSQSKGKEDGYQVIIEQKNSSQQQTNKPKSHRNYYKSPRGHSLPLRKPQQTEPTSTIKISSDQPHQSHSQPVPSPKVLSNLNFFNPIRKQPIELSETERLSNALWLYQPSSYRKKNFNNNQKKSSFFAMMLQELYQNGGNLEKSARVSQESTNRDSSVEGSRNLTEVSNKKL